MVKVERTLNTGLCLDVLMNETIFNAISEDDATINDVRIDVMNEYWVDIYVDDETIGVAQFKPIFNKCFDSHIHILPEFRKEYSIKTGEALLEWCSENLSGSVLCTTVPVFCANVVSFLEYFDFEESGHLKDAWKKNGIQNDMKILSRSV